MKKTDAIAALAALAHSARLDVFRLLVASASPRDGEGGLTPGLMAEKLGLPAPTLSFHLKELSRAGLVTYERRGRSLIYSPCVAALEALAGFLLDDCCKGVAAQGAPTETKETCL
ncbi:ArsR family transcriptional regulator [Maricaulis sp. W15]|uniref:ArsR family transcriptional regulator n=1 Tax=Maricaulis maris TaxID=74318 RepID=A0A495DKB3_9PROT|nr:MULTISPECIES: helix-turn-helix domain-containing protein [Maricaulis]OLF73068.1 ArsR family transcriptional regulator [Maricaulis sp. W15]RKR03012.1 ArsR family transcriptional regulator [Maricaulis maris]